MPQTPNPLSYTQDRDLSWLAFQNRLLDESANPAVPLLERLRFLAIFTGNLDEFFMVRVGRLTDMAASRPQARDRKTGRTPQERLAAIHTAVNTLLRRRDRIYDSLQEGLARLGLADIPYEALPEEEKAFCKSRLRRAPDLLLIDPAKPAPFLAGQALYAAVMLKDSSLFLLGAPKSTPPVFTLSGGLGGFVRTETILQGLLRERFAGQIAQEAVISVTRSAHIRREDLGPRPFSAAALIEKRKRLPPVRLALQGTAPDLQKRLAALWNLQTVYSCRCPLRLSYAGTLQGPAVYPPFTPSFPKGFSREIPLWKQIVQRDRLLFYPYHTMELFIRLLRQSSQDPAVLSIQITVYRLAEDSSVARQLCAAAEQGKEVTVFMELRARFDEENNLRWTRRLMAAGCHVFFGPERYKCHAKLCLITRSERGKLIRLTQLGTGNYNEKTARQYADFSLFTADPVLGEDAARFFRDLQKGLFPGNYQKLLTAPFSLKRTLLQLIDRETEKGPLGHIILKANALTEREIIDKLALASQRGVKVELLIRGSCCLTPGIPGITEGITVVRIVGRFLEHSRLYCFGDGPDRRLFLSSADLMSRNQLRRIESACPVESPALKAWLSYYLEVLLAEGASPSFSSQSYWLEHPEALLPSSRPRLPARGRLSRHAAGKSVR